MPPDFNRQETHFSRTIPHHGIRKTGALSSKFPISKRFLQFSPLSPYRRNSALVIFNQIHYMEKLLAKFYKFDILIPPIIL